MNYKDIRKIHWETQKKKLGLQIILYRLKI